MSLELSATTVEFIHHQIEILAKSKTEQEAVELRPIPLGVVAGLALLNSNGESMPTAAVYNFINHYFPNSPIRQKKTWKSSIRTVLCKYDFIGKGIHYTSTGEKEIYDWIFVKEKFHKFERLLMRFEEMHPDIRSYGLRNIEDWPQIRAGVKGLPQYFKEISKLKTVPSWSRESSPCFLSSPIVDVKSASPAPEDPSPASSAPSFDVEQVTAEKEVSMTAEPSPPQPQIPIPTAPMAPTPSLQQPMNLWNPMAMPLMSPYMSPMAPNQFLEMYVATLQQQIHNIKKIQAEAFKQS